MWIDISQRHRLERISEIFPLIFVRRLDFLFFFMYGVLLSNFMHTDNFELHYITLDFLTWPK